MTARSPLHHWHASEFFGPSMCRSSVRVARTWCYCVDNMGGAHRQIVLQEDSDEMVENNIDGPVPQ